MLARNGYINCAANSMRGVGHSTDYFVMPFLREMGVTAVRCSFADLPSSEELDGASVVFVRYLPAAWRALVARCRARIAAVYFFMDDDLFDRRAFAAMSLRYQWKLVRYSWSRQRWLKSVDAQLLVSTPYLQQKYADWKPQVLPARPLQPIEASPVQTVFYHGSAISPAAS